MQVRDGEMKVAILCRLLDRAPRGGKEGQAALGIVRAAQSWLCVKGRKQLNKKQTKGMTGCFKLQKPLSISGCAFTEYALTFVESRH